MAPCSAIVCDGSKRSSIDSHVNAISIIAAKIDYEP